MPSVSFMNKRPRLLGNSTPQYIDIKRQETRKTTRYGIGHRRQSRKILFMKDSTEGVAEEQTTASVGNVVTTGGSEDRAAEK